MSDCEPGVSAVQFDFASYLVQPVSGVYFEAADRGGFRHKPDRRADNLVGFDYGLTLFLPLGSQEVILGPDLPETVR